MITPMKPFTRRLHLSHPCMVMLFMCVLHEMGVSRTYAEVEKALRGIEAAARDESGKGICGGEV
jgi:hypothetical protein